MKLSIDSNEPLDHVLRVVGSLYNVSLSAAPPDAAESKPDAVYSAPRANGRNRRRPGGAGRGRAAKGGRSRPARKASAVSNSEVRSWARQNGYQVSDRGRVPVTVLAAYREAQQPEQVTASAS